MREDGTIDATSFNSDILRPRLDDIAPPKPEHSSLLVCSQRTLSQILSL